MAGKKQLKPVDFDAAPEPLSITEAAERGDYLAELKAMRMVIARHLDNPGTLARDLAALTRRMNEITKEIRYVEAEQSQYSPNAVDDVDAVADRPFRLQAI